MLQAHVNTTVRDQAEHASAERTAEDKEGAKTGLPLDSCGHLKRGTGPRNAPTRVAFVGPVTSVEPNTFPCSLGEMTPLRSEQKG